ncbi:hypothetical protein ACS0TY_009837 [Phlomoides rotata]
MDAQVVFNSLMNNEQRNNVFGHVIDACMKLLRTSLLFKLSWLRRNVNIVAHQIARSVRLFSSPNCWGERPIHVDGLPNILCTCR